MLGHIQPRIMYPLTALITVNTRHLLFSRQVWLPFFVAMIPVFLLIIMQAGLMAYPYFRNDLPDGYSIYSMLCASFYLQFLIPVLALFKGLTMFSQERGEGTLIYLLLRPVPRHVLAAGKFLAYWISTSALTGLSLSVVLGLLSTPWPVDFFWQDLHFLINDFWVLCLGLGAYGSILMVVGLLLKKALGVGILLLGWDIAATYIPGGSYRFTVKYYLQSIFPHQRQETGLSALLSDHPPASWAECLMVFGGILIVSIMLSAALLKFKEYGAAQSVE